MKLKTMNALLFLFIGIIPVWSEAKVIQILHTNDTHSFLDHSTHVKGRGGAARLKTLINKLKNEKAVEGIPSLVLDGGDFLEGNIYFMADEGRKSFKVYNEMGYDFGVLGNHDYQIGAKELDKLLGESDIRTEILTANLKVGKEYKNINSMIKPYKEIVIDGIKIALLGLTTDELFYKWRFPKDAISNPIDAGEKYEQILKDRGNDFIIALTHIGVKKDKKLADKTKYIDLIVGGHSHTALYRPIRIENKRKRLVPIVQAGEHTEYLGQLVVEIEKGKPLKVLSYQLIPVVESEEIKPDPEISKIIRDADQSLNNYYGTQWLNEVLGYSNLEVGDKNGYRKWAFFISDAIKEKTGASISIHAPEMNGVNYPTGNITRKKILNSIPRIFDVDQKFGWDIYTVNVKGIWLRLLMEGLSIADQPLAISGVDMELINGPMGLKIVKSMKVNGKHINPIKSYKVAFTEGIVRGAKGINSKTLAILRNPHNTGHKVWATLEDKIKSQNHSINDISEDNHTMYEPINPPLINQVNPNK